MKDPLISVVIPIYNVEKYLCKCIDSVINQTYKNIEVVLVNDGSPDNCFNICEEYRKLDKRIKVIHKENSGLSDARNKGLENTTGDYIIFLDSDDYWSDNNALRELVNQINEVQADLIIFGYRKYYEDINKFGKECFKCDRSTLLNSKNQLNYLMKHRCYESSSWNKVIRREILIDNNILFRKGVLCEDIEWSAKLAMNIKKYDYYQNNFLVYVQRKNSITKSKVLDIINDLFNNIKICVEIIENQKNIEFDIKKEINNYIAFQYSTLLVYLGKVNIGNNDAILKEIKKYRYLLRYGFDNRVKIIYYTSNILGIYITAKLLNLYHKFRR
ncbi:glycosyltransferase family 2 protein [uncultured Clostridium sp.]|uniref:glycosyltransferase family 2 protein n=1 Tax=uncultured Clostridium sp. TaxID=59620 RepID=UPI00258B5535|nr:glycosyltransferase family 2 protein [uncultured Clostridium sp.]